MAYANLALIVSASLLAPGKPLVDTFQNLGVDPVGSHFLAAIVVEDEVTIRAALMLGYEPSEAVKTRLAMAQRHGDQVSRRVANIIANRVASRTWHPSYAPTPADEALLDCRDLVCA